MSKAFEQYYNTHQTIGYFAHKSELNQVWNAALLHAAEIAETCWKNGYGDRFQGDTIAAAIRKEAHE